MSFYRKYRPQVFNEIDNAAVRDTLLSLLKKDKSELPHAFLFCGTRGTGKTTAARLVAKLFTCEHPKKTGEPCGTCEACLAIADGNFIDVLEIDAASNTGVDNIRDLRDKIQLTPSRSKWKVYIIDEVHMLSTGAFNALLKTLEEPPAHAVFVLATTDQHKVPPTIQSRCMTVVFKRPSLPEISGVLTRIAAAESIAITPEAVALVATAADGSFRDAVKLLEQVSLAGKQITPAVAEEMLALSGGETVQQLVTAVLERRAKDALLLIETAVGQGKDCKSLLAAVLERLEQLLKTQVITGVQTWPVADLTAAIRGFSQAYGDMRFTALPHLPIEVAVVEFCERVGGVAAVPVVPAPSAKPTPAPRTAPPSSGKSTAVPAAAPPPAAVTVTATVVPDTGDAVLPAAPGTIGDGLITLDKLQEYWKDVIESVKNVNHSAAGMLRSSRPKAVADGIVTIEAFYSFHQERLSETKTRDSVAGTLKKLFGAPVKVEVVLGKK